MREALSELHVAGRGPVFPLPRSCPFDPRDLYAAKRESEPIFKVRICGALLLPAPQTAAA
jgi:hypothetical protein